MKSLVWAAGFLIMIVIAGCDLMTHTRCNDKIIGQQKSVDLMFEVILYHRSCANDSGRYTCADLAKTSGNAAEKERQTVLTLREFHEISALWTGPKSLELTSAGLKNQKEILTQQNTWASIVISYKE